MPLYSLKLFFILIIYFSPHNNPVIYVSVILGPTFKKYISTIFIHITLIFKQYSTIHIPILT